MKTLRMLSSVILVAGFLFVVGCKKDPTGPTPIKNPREYAWTIDTITYPGSFQTIMGRIWASGPNDVYIVGHNERAFGKMFRFDGTSWTDVRLNQSQGGTISPPIGSLNGVFGFGANDIYAVGERYGNPPTSSDSSVVIHFDGVQWREQSVFPRRGLRLLSLWGATPTDIWAAGTNTLLHYDGARWSHFPIEIPGVGIHFLSISGLSASEVYMIGWREDATGNNDTVAYMLYRYDGSAWSLTDSSIQVRGMSLPKFGVILSNVSGTLYSVADGIFRKSGQEWVRIHVGASSIVGIAGTSSTRIFAVGTRTQILHFDGTDWYTYPQFPPGSIDFYSVWANDAQVFVVGNDGSRTYVARGK